jgi:KUP system potassium uptake protein
MVAGMIILCVLTWVRGSASLARATRKNEAELDWLVRKLDAKPPHRVPGTAVFLTGDPNAAPTSLMHNLKHNRVLHERNIILTIKTEDTPRVQRHERIEIERVADTFVRVIATMASWKPRACRRSWSTVRRKDLNIECPPRRSSCRGAR